MTTVRRNIQAEIANALRAEFDRSTQFTFSVAEINGLSPTGQFYKEANALYGPIKSMVKDGTMRKLGTNEKGGQLYGLAEIVELAEMEPAPTQVNSATASEPGELTPEVTAAVAAINAVSFDPPATVAPRTNSHDGPETIKPAVAIARGHDYVGPAIGASTDPAINEAVAREFTDAITTFTGKVAKLADQSRHTNEVNRNLHVDFTDMAAEFIRRFNSYGEKVDENSEFLKGFSRRMLDFIDASKALVGSNTQGTQMMREGMALGWNWCVMLAGLDNVRKITVEDIFVSEDGEQASIGGESTSPLFANKAGTFGESSAVIDKASSGEDNTFSPSDIEYMKVKAIFEYLESQRVDTGEFTIIPTFDELPLEYQRALMFSLNMATPAFGKWEIMRAVLAARYYEVADIPGQEFKKFAIVYGEDKRVTSFLTPRYED